MTSANPDRLKLTTMWNRLQAVADEQASTLMRTAFSPVVRESGDLSVGVFDVNGCMLTQAVTGTPGHVNAMAAAVNNFFDYFPRQAMRPGDVYLTNDPWLGSGHLNDFVLVRPCFRGDQLIGYVSCTSHLIDIGGECMGPDGSDVFDEGFYIPPLRLLDEGKLNDTLITLLKANSRIPAESEGDVHALLACCEVGSRRLTRMMREFGIDDLEAISGHIIETSERTTEARIEALPNGTYHNTMVVDGYDFEVTLAAKLTIHDKHLVLDFEGTSPASRHGINCPLNYTKAYTVFGIKCLIAPDIPNNAGALAPMEVEAPRGSIVNAIKPAPVCSRHIMGQLLPDVAIGCLHQVLPEVAPAEGASTLWDLPLRGWLAEEGSGDREQFSIELVYNGGTGARPSLDGLSATAFPSGVMGSLVEITENVIPVRVLRRELRTDSGGAGRQRGGLGQVIEMECTSGSDMQLFAVVDRIKFPARGRDSGSDGACGVLALGSGRQLSGKGTVVIADGDRLVMQTPGGGGYGNALTRDSQRVAEDVADALVSREVAERDYGVVLSADGHVDNKATSERRASANRVIDG